MNTYRIERNSAKFSAYSMLPAYRVVRAATGRTVAAFATRREANAYVKAQACATIDRA